jgi:hypothetical protein
LHIPLNAIIGDLSEVGDDEKEGVCPKERNRFIRGYKNLMVSENEHLRLPVLPRSAPKM